MLGLFAFFYGTLHLLTYVWLDQFFDVPDILADIAKRPFITVGLHGVRADAAAGADVDRRLDPPPRRRAGSRCTASCTCRRCGGVIHYWWLVKADTSRPFRYGAIVAVLLLARVAWAWRNSVRRAAVVPAR